MGFPFLTSRLSLFNRKAEQGLIKNAIGVGFKQIYRSPGCQQHSIRYLKLCPSSSSLFNRLKCVNSFPRGVRTLSYVKGNGFNSCEAWIVRFRKWYFKSSMVKFVQVIVALSIGCMILFDIVKSILLGSVERVPYSNRIHLVFYSDVVERDLGMKLWKEKKEYYKNLIVDQDNPEAIRVQKILNVLLGTIYKGLGLEHGYAINGTDLVGSDLSKGKKVQKSRFGLKYGTKHLEGLDWELMIIDLPYHYAFYISTGKIGFCTGSAKGLSDSQIAATIAHEIGHGVARHSGEQLFSFYWCFRVLNRVGVPKFVLTKIMLFFSRRSELEADHIGLILMASAGYDPRAALDIFCKDDNEVSLNSTHPSDKKRVKMLEKNMWKAMAIYKQVQAGQEVKSFI